MRQPMRVTIKDVNGSLYEYENATVNLSPREGALYIHEEGRTLCFILQNVICYASTPNTKKEDI